MSRLLLSRTLLLAALFGCGSGGPSPEIDPRLGKMVYFDQETKAAVVSNIMTQTPAVHPATGRPTLVPASYCAKCQRWYPAPPIEVRERNPQSAKCPKTGGPLTLDGPWPDKSL